MRQNSISTDEAGLSDARLAKEFLKVSHFDPFCVTHLLPQEIREMDRGYMFVEAFPLLQT